MNIGGGTPLLSSQENVIEELILTTWLPEGVTETAGWSTRIKRDESSPKRGRDMCQLQTYR